MPRTDGGGRDLTVSSATADVFAGTLRLYHSRKFILSEFEEPAEQAMG